MLLRGEKQSRTFLIFAPELGSILNLYLTPVTRGEFLLG